ncbi:MAG: hypothetical protein ABRQ27_14165, partial [Clostridiaceae bacterium]
LPLYKKKRSNQLLKIPLAENLIDAKVLKANEQRKKEEHLQKQVEILQTRLDQVKQETAAEVNDDNLVLEEASETDSKKNINSQKTIDF